MESGGKAGRICVSETTKDLLSKVRGKKYRYKCNEEIYVKSMERFMKTYFVKEVR